MPAIVPENKEEKKENKIGEQYQKKQIPALNLFIAFGAGFFSCMFLIVFIIIIVKLLK